MLRGPIDFDLLRLLDADALHPMLALQFERAWQIQRPVSIEEIVQRLPSADSRQLVIMLAELEFHLQQKRGEQPSAGLSEAVSPIRPGIKGSVACGRSGHITYHWLHLGHR